MRVLFRLDDSIVSQAISNLRFPLIVGVVMIHAKVPAGDNVQFECLLKLVSDYLASPCVPVFFAISGFLFFWRIDSWNRDVYYSKLATRTKTLLLPYVLWNFISIIVFALIHLLIPDSINHEYNNVLEWTFRDYLTAFGLRAASEPINYPLWFMRNLMVMVVLPPIFWFLANSKYRGGVLLFLLLAQIFIFPNGWSTAVLYFYVGALLAKERKRLYLYATDPRIKWFSLIGSILFVSLCIVIVKTGVESKALYNISRLLGSIALMSVTFLVTMNGFRVSSFITKSSILVYLSHSICLLVTGRSIITLLGNPQGTFPLFFAYGLNVSLVIGFGVVAYLLLSKHFPDFLKVLVGFR